MRSLTHTEHHKTNCIILHSQNTTALQPNVFLSGMNQLLVTNKEVSAFLPAQTTAKVNFKLLSQ